MRAMILGAGVGSRLDPLTRSLPKPIVPIVGKPVMGHLLDHLKTHNMTDVVVNVQHLGEKIIQTIGDGAAYGSRVTYSREDKLWGDAGGCKLVEGFFREDDDDTFLVTGGDDLTDIDLSEIIRQHKEKNATLTIGVVRVEDPSQFGIVVHDENGFITRFQEKPKSGAFSNLANTGIYVCSKKVFDYIPNDTFFGFGNNLLPLLLEKGEPMVAVVSENAYWKDVGNVAVYRQCQRDVLEGKVKHIVPGGDVREDGNGGKIVICAGAQIDPSAKLFDGSVVGRNAVVGANATLINTVLWDGAVVAPGTYLENCVVGEGVHVSSSHGIFNGLIVEQKRPS